MRGFDCEIVKALSVVFHDRMNEILLRMKTIHLVCMVNIMFVLTRLRSGVAITTSRKTVRMVWAPKMCLPLVRRGTTSAQEADPRPHQNLLTFFKSLSKICPIHIAAVAERKLLYYSHTNSR